MGRKKRKAKVTVELPPPKPKSDNEKEEEEEEEDDDDYSNYAHEILYGTNEFYDAKERRKEEIRNNIHKKKGAAAAAVAEEGEERKREENKKVSPSKRKTNRECKEMFGRTTRVRIPDDCLFKYFELNKVLGFKNDGDTITWLMDKAQPAIDSSMPRKDETSNDLQDLRLWKKFEVNQIWALWDDDVDGMPRLYARIRKLLFDEMKIEVALLEPVRTTDEEIRWLTDKPMACGTFKEATLTTSMEILAFSHQVMCSVLKDSYNISPRKGEIWAVYKDWNIDWTFHDFSHCRYKIVEVVADLCDEVVAILCDEVVADLCDEVVEVVPDICDESFITAICLTRISGAGEVYRRQVNGRDGLVHWQQFSGTQLLQFSHRILASKVRVEEMGGVPVESWKLDSATIPLHIWSGT